MAIKNTNTSPLLKEGANITLTQSGQVITIAANDTTNAPGGSDTQVQFNDGGNFGGDAGLTYNKTTNVLGLESIDFAQTPAAADSVRRLKWDEDEGSLVLTLKGGNITIPVGAEVVTLVYNAEATTLTKGTVVYAFGASGQRVSVKRAVNTGDSTSAQTLGVVAESIASGAEGWVMVQGLIRGIDTSAYTQGDALYLGATAGTFTKTKPYAPNHLVYIGFAVKINASSGEIFVKCQNGYELDELHNVDAQNPTNNDGIFWNSSTNLWEHKSIVTVLGYTPAPASRMITINGTSQDLTADRTWSVGTVTSIATSAPITGGNITGSGTIGITQASGSSDGYLSSGDWTNFNNKQNALTNPVTGTGSSGQVAYFNGTTSITSESNLFWDSANDRLGIGTASPASKLHISGGFIRVEGTSTDQYFLEGVRTGASTTLRIYDNNSVVYYDSYNSMAFRANQNGGNSGVIVFNGGNVLINTTTDAGYKLDVNGTGRFSSSVTAEDISYFKKASGASQQQIRLQSATDSYATQWGFGNTPNSLNLSAAYFNGTSWSDNFFTLSTSGAATFSSSVTANGLVTINKQNEGLILTAGANSDASYLSTRSNNSTGWLIVGSQGATANYIQTGTGANESAITTVGTYALTFGTNQTERMRITAGGNLLVGTTTDSTYKLDVNGTGRFSGDVTINSSTNAVLFLTANSSSNYYAMLNLTPNGTQNSYIRYGASLVIDNQSGVPSLTITSTGNLGLGVTPSAWGGNLTKAIELSGGAYITSYTNTAVAKSIYVGVNNYYNGSNYIYKENGFATQYQQYDGVHYWYNAPSGSATAAITFTQAMTLTSNGDLIIGSGADTGESLQVKGDVSTTDRIIIRKTVNNNYLSFDHAGTQTWHVKITNTDNSSFLISNDLSGGTTALTLKESGQLKLNKYTATGSFTGTTTGYLAFTNTGDVITKSPAQVLSDIGGGSGTIGGSTGSTDNAILRADGTGGATVQSSDVTIDDSGNMTLGLSGTSGTNRTITTSGSGSNLNLLLNTKGTGYVYAISNNTTGGFSSISVNNSILNLDCVNNSNNALAAKAYLYDQRFAAIVKNTTTNVVKHALDVCIETTGTPGTGIGSGLRFLTQTSGSAYKYGNTIESISTDITNGSEDFDLVFKNMTNGADADEKMRIKSTGEVWIANTADQGAYNLQVGGTGIWGAGAYVNGSDKRLKENIKPIEKGIDLVTKLKPISFNYLESFSKDQNTQSGFIAQDLLETFKDEPYLDGLVMKGSEYYNVAYQNLIPILTKAIQELKEEIEILKAKIN